MMNRFVDPVIEEKIRATRQEVKSVLGLLCRRRKETDKLARIVDKPCTCGVDDCVDCHTKK